MKKVLVVGDSMLDEYIDGSVERISPEAPIPILDFKERKVTLGGACNVAANIRTLSKDEELIIHYCGWTSPFLNHLLTNFGVASRINCEEKDILLKTRYVSNKHQILRVDTNSKYLNSLEVDLDSIKNYDLIVFSDYNKNTISAKLFVDIIQASRRDCCVLVDFKKISNFNIEEICRNTIFKSNKKEYDILTDYEKKLLDSYWCDIITTNGDKGYFINNDEEYGAAAINVDVSDIVGAGDTFLAGMAVAYLESSKFDIDELSKFANVCSAAKVSHFGTYAVKRAQVEELLNEIS